MCNCKLIGWILGGAVLFAGANASAVGPGNLGSLDNTSVDIGRTFFSSTSFTDDYTFSLTSTSDFIGWVGSFSILPKVGLAVTGITLTNTSNNQSWNDTTRSADGLFYLDPLLGSGNYKFEVTGNVTGTKGGSYGGTLQAAAVPESETWAMLLVGLGLVGLRLRKKDHKHDQLIS